MAQNYTRQSTLSDGDTITASLFNDEYNQLVNAFTYSSTSASSTGHRHDGSAGQGGNIFKIGDLDFLNKIEVDSTNNRWGFYVEVSSAAVEQIRIQDGSIVPVTTNDIDLGTSSLQFKDLYIDGTANVDSLTLTSGATVTTILDEDDLSSDSATALVTQQSIKAYVDAQVTAQDFDFQADSGGALSIDLDSETMTFTGGTGIDTTGSGNDVSFAIDSTVATLTGTQTLTNKTLTSPDVNTPDIDGGTIDGTVIGGTTPAAVSATTVSATGNITVGGTVDGRDIATDGTKLDGIEAGATADQTAAEIRTLVESATDSNVFTDADHAKLDGIEANATADQTDAEIRAAVEAATDSNVFTDADHSKLDGIEALADVTDTTNVTAAGALMDSELTSEASVKALNQGVATTDSPTFAGVTVNGTVEFDGLSGTGAVSVTDILDQDDMSSNSATALATQQSIKAYVDSQVDTVDTLSEVLANGNTSGGNDILMGDNDALRFGSATNGDLVIKHDGSDSSIVDRGDGDLLIQGSTNVKLQNFTGSKDYFVGSNGGASTVYYDGSAKLATTSTGIDVTGTVTADDSITLAATPTSLDENRLIFNETPAAGSLGSRILWRNPATGYDYASVGFTNEAGSSGGLRFKTASSVFSDSDNLRMKIADNGDISFYEDTGTTAKLFWDASAESLGIGTTSPSSSYAVDATAGYRSSAAIPNFTLVETDASGQTWQLNSTGAKLSFRDVSRAADRVVIDTAGNVGIGDSTPSQKLDVNGNVRVTGGYIEFAGDTSTPSAAASMHRPADNTLAFVTANTERMRIDSSGEFTLGNPSGGSALQLDVSATGTDGVDIKSSYYSGGYGPMKLHAGGSERMRINSSGNVGINTQSPAATLHTVANSGTTALLTVGASGNNIASFYTSGSSQVMTLDASGNLLVGTTNSLPGVGNTTAGISLYNDGRIFASKSANTTMSLNRSTSDGAIAEFRKDGSTVGSIGTVGGHLAVGGGDVFLEFNSTGDALQPMSTVTGGASNGAVDLGASLRKFKDLYLSGVVNVGGGIQNSIPTSSGFGYVNFGDADDANIGQILYDHDDNYMRFQVNNQERARLDASGNLLVGTTDTTLYNNTTGNGFMVFGSGGVHVAKESSGATDPALLLNNTGDDGQVIRIAKDGSTVGSVGTRANRMYIGTGDVGVLFDSANNTITPENTSTPASSDAAIDIGRSSIRFKDLYLSGGAYLGGTGSANHLDDYEEGTFTPAVRNSTSSGSVTYSAQNGHYVKVGKFVSATFYLVFTKGSLSGGTLQFTGLPFTVDSLTNMYPQAAILIDNLEAALSNPLLQITNGQTTGDFIEGNGSTGNHAGLSVATYIDGATSAIQIRGTLNYIAA